MEVGMMEAVERQRKEHDSWTVPNFLEAFSEEISRLERLKALQGNRQQSDPYPGGGLGSGSKLTRFGNKRQATAGQSSAAHVLHSDETHEKVTAEEALAYYDEQNCEEKLEILSAYYASRGRQPPIRYCVYCDLTGSHFSEECRKVATLEARLHFLLENRRCQRCTRNHEPDESTACRNYACFHCKLHTHHRSLCPTLFQDKPQPKPGAEVAQRPATALRHHDSPVAMPATRGDGEGMRAAYVEGTNGSTVLQATSAPHVAANSRFDSLTMPCIARARITNGSQTASSLEFILMDSGCDDSYVQLSLAQQLGLELSDKKSEYCNTFGEVTNTSYYWDSTLYIWLPTLPGSADSHQRQSHRKARRANEPASDR
jgi:hypothetical protein